MRMLMSSLPPQPSVAEESCSSGLMRWSYEEVHAGTEGFSPRLQVGEGGFGVVYKATLRNTVCAVKVLRQASGSVARARALTLGEGRLTCCPGPVHVYTRLKFSVLVPVGPNVGQQNPDRELTDGNGEAVKVSRALLSRLGGGGGVPLQSQQVCVGGGNTTGCCF